MFTTITDEGDWFDLEPSASELDAIEIEWPQIEHELEALERELAGAAPERLVDFDIDHALGDTLAPGFPTFSLS